MAYLRWSGSTWFAFSSTDGGDGDKALLVAWHAEGADATVTARELLRAGCVGQPERLRTFMERWIRVEEHAKRAAMKDIEVLAPAVRRFLFDVYTAGKIVMPPDVANRHRELKQRIDEALTERCGEHPVDSRGVSMLLESSVELEDIRRRYPPPRPSLEIRELMHARALRMLRGEDVSPEQDALERARIAGVRVAAFVSEPTSEPTSETRTKSCNEPVSNGSRSSTRSPAIAAACVRAERPKTATSSG